MGRLVPPVLVVTSALFAAAPAVAADQAVMVLDNSFAPEMVGLKPGESVTWTAAGTANRHNVVFEDGGLISPSPAEPGPWKVARKFPADGAYRYFCEIHGAPGGIGMAGAVFVNATANTPPVARLTASPNPSQTGQTVTFGGSSSTDLNGTIAKYEWDLDGDGPFETDTLGTPTASRSYTSPGTFSVKLRVTDDEGATGETTRSLRVNAAPVPPPAVVAPALAAPTPAGIPSPLPPSFSASKRTITVGKSGRFSYSFAAEAGLTGTIGFEALAKVRASARRRISLGTMGVTVPPSGTATVQVKLSRKNQRILKRLKRIKFRATVTLRNAAGISRSGTTTFTLKSAGRG